MQTTKVWQRPLVIGFVVTGAGFLFFSLVQKWNGVDLAIPAAQLVDRLAPLVLAAAFIERAVEIVVSPLRDTGATKLARVVAAIKARPTVGLTPVQVDQNAADLQVASDELDDYRGVTQQYAFAIGLILSFCAAVAGVRAHWPFLAHPETFSKLDVHQQEFFRNFDVVITTALLAGGADGIHSIVNSVTSFFPKNSGPDK